MLDGDNLLITNILNGDTDSFSILVNRYEKQLFIFLLRLTSSREDAEEILQDVFIRVYNYLYKYDNKWQFRTWIYRIAVNVFKDFYKRKKKRVEQPNYTLEDISSASGIEDDYEEKELFNEVVTLINKLKDDQRTAFILKHIKGFSYNEIAKILGTSPDNARMKVCRAKQSICNEILNKRGGKK